MSKRTLTSFDFTVTGLEIVETNPKTSNTLRLIYDVQSTANLLKEMGAIEDYSVDLNGEPVILYTSGSHIKKTKQSQKEVSWLRGSGYIQSVHLKKPNIIVCEYNENYYDTYSANGRLSGDTAYKK